MDIAYRFGDPTRLYLNPTNRCTNRCSFCLRYQVDGVGDGSLWGGPEPDLPGLLAAVEAKRGSGPLREIIWCGFGEPTYRLDLITGAASRLHDLAGSVRLNTNGHACLIHGRDVLPELAAAVDDVSVSLNAPTRERYLELCRPDLSSVAAGGSTSLDARSRGKRADQEHHGAALHRAPDVEGGDSARAASPDDFWDAMVDFLARSVERFRSVQASVVGSVLTAEEIQTARLLARSVGVEKFRVR